MKLKGIIYVIAALLFSGAAITNSFAADSFTVGDFTYTVLSDGENVSVKWNGTSSLVNIEIPAQITNPANSITYTVTTVANNAFNGCSNLKSIILPSTITTILANAFKNCTILKTIKLSASLTEINSSAFYNDKKLETVIFEGASAPILNNVFSQIYTPQFTLQVISTAAKESFEAHGNWSVSIKDIVIVPVAINESADNSSALTAHAGHTADVNLTRTIRHESYNSICLPFSLSVAQVESVFGAGCDIEELTDASFVNDEITLVFTQRTAMEAGKPYLIKPASTVTNPTVHNAVLTNVVVPSGNTDVTFSGIFSATLMEASDNILVVGAENTLHPVTAGDMLGLRGYFVLNSDRARTAAKRGVHLSMGTNNEETAVEAVRHIETQTKCIIDGQLHIIRNGVHYNARGVIIQ